MEDKNSLNNKYQKIDIDAVDTVSEVVEPEKENPKKEKKEKQPKQPKEKKVKEKKVKEPKPMKEKKVKEPKPPKEKKPKKEKIKKSKKEVTVTEKDVQVLTETEVSVVASSSAVEHRTEQVEISLPAIKSVKKIKETKPKKDKKSKESKPKKEKKVKEPKIKKEKAPKQPKEPKVKKEKKPREPLGAKDFVTIGLAIVAVAMVVAFVWVKFFSTSEIEVENTESTTEASGDKLSSIQVVRDGVSVSLIQSDISNIFYGFSVDYELQYYQYKENDITPVKSTGTLETSVDLGNETIPVKIEYVELGDELFGVGMFVAGKDDVYFYDMVAFKLVDLPSAFAQEGKALLLATTSKSALTQKVTLWPESFVVDLETGKTSRFLKIGNRGIDINTGAGVDDFCILTNESYGATGSVPFITSREYSAEENKQDIFIKNGTKETVYVSDVYGRYLLTDGNALIYMKQTAAGFDVIRKTGDEEKTVVSLYGSMTSDYIYADEYVFNRNDGKLYNLKTGEVKLIVGYRMSPEMMAISPDGKYLVMLGTVVNMMDYQVHIFNLETGEYAKYVDDNYSNHSNLTFINDTTAVYVVLDPNQGYEYVVLDATKVK